MIQWLKKAFQRPAPRPDPMREVDAALAQEVAQLDSEPAKPGQMALPPITHPFPDGGMYGRLD